MSGRSLQVRLLLAGLVALVVALCLAGLALTLLFERHLERRAIAESETHLRTLIAGAALDTAGKLTLVSPPNDPLFGEAYSGLYWQIDGETSVLARSRSLWDAQIALPQDEIAEGGVHVHALPGPRQGRLLVVERGIFLTSAEGAKRFRLAVALDRRDITRARDEFLLDLALALGVLGLVLAAAFVVQVRIGLTPLKEVRNSLFQVRTGENKRLSTDLPVEVIPLVEEINTLLDDRDRAVGKARGRAADLAHGLKTPLTALNADVRRLREADQPQIAGEIEALGAIMQRHVQRELARARLAGRTAATAPIRLRPVLEGLAAAIARTHWAAGKAFDFDSDPDLHLAMDRADLEELLGNLMENAARHAASVVRISASDSQIGYVLSVDDDGAGVDEAAMERILQRGIRLDQSGGGAGLGLSIASDVVEAYGGELALARSDLGGLSVIIRLPRLTAER